MKSIYKNRIIAIIFLIFIGFFSSLTIAKIGIKVVSKVIQKTTVAEAVEINLTNETLDNKKTNEKSIKDEEDIEPVSLSDKLRSLIGKVENKYNDNLYKKMMFIEINGYFQKLLGKDIINDAEINRTVIKDNKGYLHFNLTEKPIDISYQSKNISNLNKFCNDNDIRFMYVQAPCKFTGEKGQLPGDINDYSNYIADNLLKELKKQNVPYLDLRDSMKENYLTYEEMFFRTDHHWTIESGFWAYTKLAKELNLKYGVEFDKTYLDEGNYDLKVIKNNFIGSQGKRTGKYYTDIDDTRFYTPKFSTSLKTLLFNDQGNFINKREGDFYNSLINTDAMESNNVYISKYESFLDSNNETHIINNKSTNDKKILFIKDSFARPVAGYMSLNFQETRLLDLRTYKGNTYKYIEEYNPDIIIMLYNPSCIKEKDMFNFEY